MTTTFDDEEVSRCPACGDPIDFCQGHGEIGDPSGFAVLAAHDDGDHSGCHPDGCDEARAKPVLQLSGEDGNAFSILARAAFALKRAGRSEDVARYQAEATAGTYEDLLRVTALWFDVR